MRMTIEGTKRQDLLKKRVNVILREAIDELKDNDWLETQIANRVFMSAPMFELNDEEQQNVRGYVGGMVESLYRDYLAHCPKENCFVWRDSQAINPTLHPFKKGK